MANPDIADALGIKIKDGDAVLLGFPYHHEGVWHQCEMMIGSDNSFSFHVDGEKTQVQLDRLWIVKGLNRQRSVTTTG